MKRKIYNSIVFVFLALVALVRCTEPEIEPYQPIDLSPYDAAASYFDYGGYSHFYVTFASGSNAVALHLCSDMLSTSDEKLVQSGDYSYSTSLQSGALTSLSTLNGASVSSGDITIEKDFLTYTISGTIDGTAVSYTGYIFTVTSTATTMKINACVEESDALKLTNDEGDTLYVPYSDSYVGTITLDENSYLVSADGTSTEISEGTLTITEADKVFSVSGTVMTSEPNAITVTGKWSNAAIISGTIDYTGVDQPDYGNSYWTVTVEDNSGFTMDIVIIADVGATFYSESGTTLDVASTWANNTIVAGYDWGDWGSGGTFYTLNGSKNAITSGSLKFTSADGETVTIEGSISDGTNTYDISGDYMKPAQFNYMATSDWTAYGGTYSLLFGTNDMTATYNWNNWAFDYTGTGTYLSIEFKQAVAAGTYTALANDDASFDAASNFIIGYYNSTYYSYSGAMCGEMTDGSISLTDDNIISGGTVTVTEDAGTYTFTFNLELATGDKVNGSCTATL